MVSHLGLKLTDPQWSRRLEQNHRYLLALEPDRLLHNFRINAGIPSHAKPLGGWVRGHFVGHYLSACSIGCRATSDAADEGRTRNIQLGRLQDVSFKCCK